MEYDKNTNPYGISPRISTTLGGKDAAVENPVVNLANLVENPVKPKENVESRVKQKNAVDADVNLA